ncbi:hypothetical protein ACJMK2_016740 [Sinanodonta woodiana]|uniref:MAGE domain-containing protein n=1 Tax=Sinanodonta woodiana TaxID=1069815 RepID=A0ABD3UUN7_SINWO
MPGGQYLIQLDLLFDIWLILIIRAKDRDGTTSSQAAGASQTMNQAVKAAASMDRGEMERKTNDLVQYLLIMDQKKIPIKKQDINKHVLKDVSKAFPIIFEKATERLSKIFGVEVVELQDKLKGSYILVNKLDVGEHNPAEIWPDEENAKTGLLMVLLSLIFMNGNVMEDTQMWHTLKKFGIEQDHHHEVFGDVKKLITQEFVRQGYIEIVRQTNTDPPVNEFKWGQRAKHETTKRKVLTFVCQIYNNDMEPRQWTLQWQDVLRSEGRQDDVEQVI